ncbi:DUF2339 domain-containing protein [Sporosarcina cyprini]|uniref:DUF2339 domain-containing protein n=1 Tax=Sporosarcina cyprini TaxID=2910523 RepID=UPI001EE0C1D9|nr:DUF2339 domain-containing protein [Sporosarcina cyprini]MCG3087513.1 DUF2339 domain-containing protein [Sporosarcina cyprini]
MSKDLDGIQKRMSELEQELLHLKKELAEKESSQPAEPVEPTEPTEPVEPERVDSAEPVEMVEPTDPVEPAEPAEVVEPEEPVKPLESAEPEERVEPIEPEERVESAEPVNIMHTEPSVPLETYEESGEPVSEEIHQETVRSGQEGLAGLSAIPPRSVSSTKMQSPEMLMQSQAQQAEKPEKADFNLERMLGLWLPRVFMFILLLGVLWGLKVAFDNGWITDWVRILLGYAGTALLYYAGMRNIKNSRAPFGLTLLGGFIALGILTTFAAHHLYGYFPYIVAFLIAVAYIAAGLWLSSRLRSETLTVFSAIAGFLLPFLLEDTNASTIQFAIYLLLLFMSLFYISLKQGHTYSFYVSFSLYHLTLVIFTVMNIFFVDKNIIVLSVLVQHIVLLVSYLRGLSKKAVSSEIMLYANAAVMLFWVAILEYEMRLAVYGFLVALYGILATIAYKKGEKLGMSIFTAISIVAASVLVLSCRLDEPLIQLTLMLVIATLGLWLGIRFDTIRLMIIGAFAYSIVALAILTVIHIDSFVSIENLIWAIFIYTIVLIFYSLTQNVPSILKGQEKLVNISFIAGQLVLLIYVGYMANLLITAFDLNMVTSMHVFFFAFLIAMVITFSFVKWHRGIYLAHAAVIEFLVLGLFVLLFNLTNFSNTDGLWLNLFVQIVYVICLSYLFWTILKGKFYFKPERFIKVIPALAVTMQVLYFIFLNKWYLTIAFGYEWEWEYILFVHTFLLMAFAFISFSIGKVMNWKVVKILAAILVGFSLLKLFIVDMASISLFIRAILFIVVGIVGLLYSRTLLKDESTTP